MKYLNKDKDDDNPLQALAFLGIGKFNKCRKIALHPPKHIFELLESYRYVKGGRESVIELAQELIFPDHRRCIINVQVVNNPVFGVKCLADKFEQVAF